MTAASRVQASRRDNFLFFRRDKRRNYMELKPVKSLQVLLRLSILIQKAVAPPALPFFVS